MKLFGYVYPAFLALLISSASYGAQKTITWRDGALCEFETRFDPAKIDEERLRNTAKVIFGDGFYKQPTLVTALIGPGGSLTSNTAEHQQACERPRHSPRRAEGAAHAARCALGARAGRHVG